MKSFLKGMLGVAAVVGAGAFVYHKVLTPQTRRKVKNTVGHALDAGREMLQTTAGASITLAQQLALEKSKAWIEEQWERAGF